MIGADALQDIADPAEADAVELRRWPAVLDTDICGRFAWRCQFGRCHKPGRVTCQADLYSGEVFCEQHLGFHSRIAA
jgi:hypothetical protein